MSVKVKAENSCILKVLKEEKSFSVEEESRLCHEEARWHFSQHYFAELRGEEVIESMLEMTFGRKPRAILEAQLIDELAHAKTYKVIVNKIGLIDESKLFAEQYSNIVLNLTSLPEKIFAFQVLTESVAQAYITWRLQAIDDADCNNSDRIVLEDEIRHLDMANALLRICPKEEVNFHLPLQRRGELVREVLTVTKDSFQKSTAYCSSLFGIDVNDVTLISTDLDFIVKKTVLKEAHRQIRSLSVGH